jgi:hypothetical protein
LGINWEFDNFTISSRSIVVKSRISGKISSCYTSIALRISWRTSGIAKDELGFWSFGDVVAPTRLTFNFGDLGQVPTNGNFGPLSKELYDLGNILE